MAVDVGEKQTLLNPEKEPQIIDSHQYGRKSWMRPLGVYGSSFILALLVSFLFNVAFLDKTPGCDDPERGYRCRPEISRYWGQYSPYFATTSEIEDIIPDDCEITFAQVLSRHGARDPTLKRTLKYSSTITKIQATAPTLTGKYAFLRKYRYKLGADQLNAFGRNQLYSSGAKFYKRYQALAKDAPPFIRTSGQQRVVDSADAWMQGFYDAKKADESAKKDAFPYDMVMIYEGPEFNNTLTHSLCKNIEDGPLSYIRPDAKDAWANVFGPSILARLQEDLPFTPIKIDDMHNLMSMCPFDTVRTAKGRISPFCDLFTEQEWHQYNQLESLDKFYGWGNGNPLGPTNGVGFTNELIARMTNKPVDDHTSTNRTLDEDIKTFPYDKNHNLFADFSHDNDLTAIFFAMGLYNSTPMLSITKVDSIQHTKGWSSAWTVPFGARAYFEKMKCKSRGDEELVRVIVNDRVVPLKSCGADDLGRCSLSSWVESLSFARQGGHWDRCFSPSIREDYSLPSGRQLILEGPNATTFVLT